MSRPPPLTTADLQPLVDAGAPLPPGRHRLTEPLLVRKRRNATVRGAGPELHPNFPGPRTILDAAGLDCAIRVSGAIGTRIEGLTIDMGGEDRPGIVYQSEKGWGSSGLHLTDVEIVNGHQLVAAGLGGRPVNAAEGSLLRCTARNAREILSLHHEQSLNWVLRDCGGIGIEWAVNAHRGGFVRVENFVGRAVRGLVRIGHGGSNAGYVTITGGRLEESPGCRVIDAREASGGVVASVRDLGVVAKSPGASVLLAPVAHHLAETCRGVEIVRARPDPVMEGKA